MLPIKELRDVDAHTFRTNIINAYEPVVLRGAVAAWPAAEAGGRSSEAMRDYLLGFDRGAIADAFVAPPEVDGRFFYTPDLRGLNFQRRQGALRGLIETLVATIGHEHPPGLYAGAMETDQCLPGFSAANRLDLVEGLPAVPRIWIGNKTLVSTHIDASDNVACVVAGSRRFTLFPPDQVANLYVGPLDFTPAGQPVSMVDIDNPDFDRYPRFRQAQEAAQTAVLESGDAIYIPALWWHQIEALARFNVLVNYWWNDSPETAARFESMVHAIFALSALPPERRAAWAGMFDHFALQRGGDPAAHLPRDQRGVLDAMTPPLRQRIRTYLGRAFR